MKAIPEVSVDTRLLVERIRAMQPGETVGYDDLRGVIGRDVRSCPHLLATARKRALRDHGIVTEAVMAVGIKRLRDSEVVSTVGESSRRRIRRLANRAVEKMTAVDFGALSDADKVKHNAELSQLAAVRAFSNESVTKKIEHKVTASAGPLAIAKTLEAFKE